jgi:hypothetical protein
VFRFTIRELLWLTLIVAVAMGWLIESQRSRVWRERAQIAVDQLEAEGLGQMVFGHKGVMFRSSYYDAPLQEAFYPTDSAP